MALSNVVVAGAGLAGLRAAEALRGGGFEGRLTLVSAEPEPPYDRPPLSKEVLRGEQALHTLAFRAPEHFDALDVRLLLGSPATALDLHERALIVDGRRLPFDGLVIATGARARRLAQGEALEGVHVLRTATDAAAIVAELAKRPRVLVVGAGFIGGEVAASCRSLGLDVTMVEAAATPLARAIGPELGSVYADLHSVNGVRLRLGVGVERLDGVSRVERAVLTDGTTVAADLVVVGVGAAPNVEWLRGSGLTLRDGIVCDATLNAGAPAVYAAGDLARWPNPLFGEEQRCEQWTNAAEQGRLAARNLLAGEAQAAPFAGSNSFWSDQHGVRIQFAGVSRADEVRIVDGDPAEHRFLAVYRRGNRVVGALAMDCARSLMRTKILIERHTTWDAALALQ